MPLALQAGTPKFYETPHRFGKPILTRLVVLSYSNGALAEGTKAAISVCGTHVLPTALDDMSGETHSCGQRNTENMCVAQRKKRPPEHAPNSKATGKSALYKPTDTETEELHERILPSHATCKRKPIVPATTAKITTSKATPRRRLRKRQLAPSASSMLEHKRNEHRREEPTRPLVRSEVRRRRKHTTLTTLVYGSFGNIKLSNAQVSVLICRVQHRTGAQSSPTCVRSPVGTGPLCTSRRHFGKHEAVVRKLLRLTDK